MERIVGNCLNRLARLINSDIVKTVKGTFEDALQTSYFDSCNGLKNAMVKVVEHGLAEVVRCGRGHTVTESKSCRLFQLRSVAESIVRTVFSSTIFIVLMAEIVRNLVDRAFDENQLRQLNATSTPTTGTELTNEWSSSDRRHKILSSQLDTESDKDHCHPHSHRRSSSGRNSRDKSRSCSRCSETESESEKSSSRRSCQDRKTGESDIIAV